MYSSDEDIALDGETDHLTRERLSVLYPSELQWSSLYGPWPAAPLPPPPLPKRFPSSFPCTHPSYARDGMVAPEGFLPPVLSRALVLPPRTEPYYSFRFKPVLERIIEEHEASVKYVCACVG